MSILGEWDGDKEVGFGLVLSLSFYFFPLFSSSFLSEIPNPSPLPSPLLGDVTLSQPGQWKSSLLLKSLKAENWPPGSSFKIHSHIWNTDVTLLPEPNANQMSKGGEGRYLSKGN